MNLMGAWWASGLERRIGDRVVLGSNSGDAASLFNFGNFVYPTFQVPFGGDTKMHRSLLSGFSLEVKYPRQGINVYSQEEIELNPLKK